MPPLMRPLLADPPRLNAQLNALARAGDDYLDATNPAYKRRLQIISAIEAAGVTTTFQERREALRTFFRQASKASQPEQGYFMGEIRPQNLPRILQDWLNAQYSTVTPFDSRDARHLVSYALGAACKTLTKPLTAPVTQRGKQHAAGSLVFIALERFADAHEALTSPP